MTMNDFIFWSWVIGGTPLALALSVQAVEWSRHAVDTRAHRWRR
jgi:hypothetical protein